MKHEWTGSVIDKVMLKDQIGKFLRTHRHGHALLLNYLESIPANRTEEQYVEECEREAIENEQAIDQHLADYNERRRLDGLPPIDRKGNVVTAIA